MILDKNLWEPISVNQLTEMTNDEMGSLLSVCWHEGKLRYETIGIYDIQLDQHFTGGKSYFKLGWSNNSSDPRVYVDKMDTIVDNIGDGEWNYGIYKKK